MAMNNGQSKLWRTTWEPMPDITAYEIALDMKYVNASQIVGDYYCDKLGTALRHRVIANTNERMDVVWQQLSHGQGGDGK